MYLCPRAPTNTWMLWHESHIDTMFDRLIEDLIVLEDVDPNRVYLMGYSAGGDGVYQLAPRMADRFAAASMMAGHPNDASPLGLRNLPFSIHVGAVDNGFDRNKVALEWEGKLAALRAGDLEGYVHWVKLYEGKAHWMDGQDAAAVPWMQQFTRNPLPAKVVWKQGNTTHERFYWLAVEAAAAKDAKGKLVTAAMDPRPPTGGVGQAGGTDGGGTAACRRGESRDDDHAGDGGLREGDGAAERCDVRFGQGGDDHGGGKAEVFGGAGADDRGAGEDAGGAGRSGGGVCGGGGGGGEAVGFGPWRSWTAEGILGARLIQTGPISGLGLGLRLGLGL